MKRLLLLAAALTSIVFLCGADGGGCDSSVLEDPTFDLWCGEELCGWQTTQGSVERVATWHRSDYGASLVGDVVELRQRVDTVDNRNTDCLELRLLADHDDGVNITIEIDFNSDGQSEVSQPMASDRYRDVTVHVKPPPYFNGATFIIRKTGAGHAVLAEVKAKDVEREKCVGLKAIELSDQPDGAPCGVSSSCTSAHCVKVPQWIGGVLPIEVCSQCQTDADCQSGVCGIDGGAGSYVFRACVAAGSRVLGERCVAEGECKSGVCCGGRCSECCSGASPCPGGVACFDRTSDGARLPYQCLPTGRKSGEQCLRDSDCASASCSGAGELKVCELDGARCSGDDDCAFGGCKLVGVVDGTCD